MTLVERALAQPLVTVALTLGMAGLGLWSFKLLQIEAYPDISDTQVVVVAQYPGHASEEMEQQITVPLERALNGVPNVIARRSRTIFGLSVVELTFAYGVNDWFARQVVSERLKDAGLPEGVEPELGPLTTPTGELYRYVLEGGGRSDMELRELQDWVVAPRIMQEQGVADVPSFGGQVKQYQIEVDPLALEKYNITISQIAKAVGANNRNAGGALLDNRQQSMVVRGVGLLHSVADIENVVLGAARGAPVFVRDVARVRIGPALETGIFGLNGKTGGVEGIVLMRRGENPSEVLEAVKTAVAEINETKLPAGVRVTPIYDRTELIHNTLGTVSRTLAEGLSIVFVVLLFFLGSLRAALLTALVVPLSLLFAFACMFFAGTPASLLSLGALDFGIIVDGTLVMVEFVMRRGEARKAAIEVQRPILFSLLILVCAYIPLFTLQRVERRLFTPMAFTVCAALAGSLMLTMTFVPVMAERLFRRGGHEWQNPLFRLVAARYSRDIALALRRPWTTLAIAGLVAGAGLATGLRLGTEFLPQLDEGLVWIRANLPPGISLAKSAEMAGQIRELIRRSPEVRFVSSQTGRVDSGTDPFGANRNEFLVALNPYDTWAPGKQKKDLVDELSARLRDNIPGTDFNFTQPIIDMVTEAVTGSSADLAVIVHGPDLGALRRYGRQTLAMLKQMRGAQDTAIEQEDDQPQLRIEVNRQALARYALNVEDVQDLIEMAIGGRTATSLLEGERKFDVTVRYIPEARASQAVLGSMLVHAPDGARVPLSELAAIRVADGASIIARRENQRQITVRVNIRGRDQGGFVAEAQRRFARTVKLAPGYHVVWGGQFENLDRAQHRLKLILPLTLAIIFTLLFWAFGSALDAALVLVNVPLSIAGGVAALYMRGINLSVSAAVGFISLFGVAVMGGVLYIAEMRRQRALGGSLEESVAAACRAQLRPMMMLIAVAMLGMMPAALARGIGSDIQRPLATVVVGGLCSTLLLGLFVLPVLYLLKERAMASRVMAAQRKAEC